MAESNDHEENLRFLREEAEHRTWSDRFERGELEIWIFAGFTAAPITARLLGDDVLHLTMFDPIISGTKWYYIAAVIGAVVAALLQSWHSSLRWQAYLAYAEFYRETEASRRRIKEAEHWKEVCAEWECTTPEERQAATRSSRKK